MGSDKTFGIDLTIMLLESPNEIISENQKQMQIQYKTTLQDNTTPSSSFFQVHISEFMLKDMYIA